MNPIHKYALLIMAAALFTFSSGPVNAASVRSLCNQERHACAKRTCFGVQHCEKRRYNSNCRRAAVYCKKHNGDWPMGYDINGKLKIKKLR